jgi:outer membrane receptor protein involved in Fe transport
VQLRSWVGIHGVVSRGFRAPNLNDIGAAGLNDLGYEVPAREAAAAGAVLSTSAGDNATSTGRPLQPLGAERLYNYEAGVRLTTGPLYIRVQAFDAELLDPIVRRTLLFPVAAAPTTLAGVSLIPINSTLHAGVIAVGTAVDPRAIKAFVNDGHSRYYGFESLVEATMSPRWSLRSAYSFIAGRELNPNRPIRRLPPQTGHASVHHRAGRWWIEPSVNFAGAQSRLSGGDIDDERIGASRRPRDIIDFFNGDLARPYIRDGVFTPTGETLTQIVQRVLPGVAETARIPLYSSTAGWISVNVFGGMLLGERTSVTAALTNLADRNYRIHGSGVDAPGRSAWIRLRYAW